MHHADPQAYDALLAADRLRHSPADDEFTACVQAAAKFRKEQRCTVMARPPAHWRPASRVSSRTFWESGMDRSRGKRTGLCASLRPRPAPAMAKILLAVVEPS